MPSKKMSKTRQLSALVNFVSRLRANRTKARTRAFMRWRLNLEASRAAAAERLSSQILARAAAASARGQRLACVVLASTMLKSWRRSAFRRWRRPRRISLERPTVLGGLRGRPIQSERYSSSSRRARASPRRSGRPRANRCGTSPRRRRWLRCSCETPAAPRPLVRDLT